MRVGIVMIIVRMTCCLLVSHVLVSLWPSLMFPDVQDGSKQEQRG